MNRFERKFLNFSIKNLTMYVLIGRIAGFLLILFNSSFYANLIFDANSIMHGEIWRLFTFIFIPDSDPFWFIFEVMMLYWIGTSLERIWGSFRYTMYYLGAVLGVALAAVFIYFTDSSIISSYALALSLPGLFIYSLFLPFAWYHGDEVMNLIIIPVKVKYLAAIDILLIIKLFADTAQFPSYGYTWAALIISMVNVLVFFIYVLIKRAKQKRSNLEFKNKIKRAEKAVKQKAVHRCSICGVTEVADPGMSFRYCSKCDGDHEFCEKHLTEHEHFKKVIDINKYQ